MKTILLHGFSAFVLLLLSSCSHPAPDDLVKINKKRIPMDLAIATLCAPPAGASISPHSFAEADVYVNSRVLSYRSKHPGLTSYPVGSTFVKKKYSRPRQQKPDDLATLMTKKASTGKISDWEFHFLRLRDGKLIAPPERSTCIKCHQRYKSRGYISRESEKALQEHLGALQK